MRTLCEFPEVQVIVTMMMVVYNMYSDSNIEKTWLAYGHENFQFAIFRQHFMLNIDHKSMLNTSKNLNLVFLCCTWIWIWIIYTPIKQLTASH